jgi:hypothetical protein
LPQRDAERQVLSDTAQLTLNASIDHLEVTRDITGRDAIAFEQQYATGLKSLEQRTIRRFSHAKDKEKIKGYVEQHFVISETFALRIPVSVLALMSARISEFSRKP